MTQFFFSTARLVISNVENNLNDISAVANTRFLASLEMARF